MGNKCTCFNNITGNQDCDLSNKTAPKLRKSKNSVPDSYNDFHDSIKSNSLLNITLNYKKDFLLKYKIPANSKKLINNVLYDNITHNRSNSDNISQKDKNNENIIPNSYNNGNKIKLYIPPYKATLLSSKIKGFLFRKKYKSYLREQLKKHGNDLYTQYLLATKNPKVLEIINETKDPKIISYLKAEWDQFYQEDPTSEIKQKISKRKKYSKGLIFKYRKENFESINIIECLGSAIYCYKGEVDLYTNKKCGYGETIFSDGAHEQGTYYNNEFSGWNTYIDREGILFVGLYLKGVLNGKGLRYNKEIDHIYKGDFVNSMRDGVGKDYRINSKYDGEFKNDKKCGKGKIVLNSGDIYEGEFYDNKFNGYGHYIWSKNGNEYKGNYLNGKFHGDGFYKWGENEYYRGKYVNGIKEGEGEISYADGKKFFVNFTNGKPNGIGIFQDPEGNRCEVEFINGIINKKYRRK